jgi:GNAT superfamily N-acetyltransferase
MNDTDLAALGVLVRPARQSDVDVMVAFRVRMFQEMGWTDESRFRAFVPAATAHLHEGFSAGTCNGFIAEKTGPEGDRAVIGTVALVWQHVAPTVRNVEGRMAYILGMYVVPEWRRRGIARALMTAAVACATEKRAPLITLHASDEGRVLYEQLGFASAPEMRLFTEYALPSGRTPANDAD